MDLLLTHGYFLSEDEKEQQIMKPYPPLGLLYICSHLRAQSFDVEVYDSTFGTFAELSALLRTLKPAVLGIYANLMTRRMVVKILAEAKQAGWKTIVGGPEPGAYVAEYLAAGADVVVIGEGERTLEELLGALKANSDDELSKIDGIAFRANDGTIRRTAPRTQISDLDLQPWPARDAIDMDRYVRTWRQHHGQGSVSLITARGCPYHCKWCSHQVYGKTHRRRDPIKVVDEVQFLLDRYAPDMMWLADDVFTIHHGWLERYAAEMQRRKLVVPFECISRADRLNQRVVDLLTQLGCFRVWIGSESGSQRILDAMERGVSVAQVQSAISMCKSAGIQTGMFLMWGYEGEQLDDIEATVDHVKRSRPDVFLTTISYPIRGTAYFDEVSSRVATLHEWANSSDREFKIRGRHSRRYYGFADQLLRAEAERERRSQQRMDTADLDVTIAAARQAMRDCSEEVEA